MAGCSTWIVNTELMVVEKKILLGMWLFQHWLHLLRQRNSQKRKKLKSRRIETCIHIGMHTIIHEMEIILGLQRSGAELQEQSRYVVVVGRL